MEAERMGRRKWKSLKERLALMGCCASSRSFRASNPTTTAINDEEEEGYRIYPGRGEERAAAVEEMNLAAALAAERQYRAASATAAVGERGEGAPVRVSLMRLLEEGEVSRGGEEGWCWCCVCLGRRKGAAFIPCGHTFCRVCARELWVNRGTCPLCNRPILDILDIF